MTYGSLLALFRHNLSCLPVAAFRVIVWMCLLFFNLYKLGPKMGLSLCVVWHPFSILVRPCSARVSLKIPWLVLGPFCFWFNCFRYLIGSIWASKTVPFGTRICKTACRLPQTPKSKELFLSGPGAEPCRRQLWSAPGPKAPRAC